MTTLLVYLGYLTFDFDTKEIWMLDNRIYQEFINFIGDGEWENVARVIHQSDALLDATLQRNEKAVEEIIDKIY